MMKEIEITTGMSGYPEHLHRGYVGFETYDEAEAFAKENGGEVVLLHRKDGWSLYESRGRKYEPICVTAEDYGDDYTMYEKREDYEDYCREFLAALIDKHVPLSDIREAVDECAGVADMFDLLDDGQAIVIRNGVTYHDTVRVHTMEFSEDTDHWYVGVETHGKQSD